MYHIHVRRLAVKKELAGPLLKHPIFILVEYWCAIGRQAFDRVNMAKILGTKRLDYGCLFVSNRETKHVYIHRMELHFTG